MNGAPTAQGPSAIRCGIQARAPRLPGSPARRSRPPPRSGRGRRPVSTLVRPDVGKPSQNQRHKNLSELQSHRGRTKHTNAFAARSVPTTCRTGACSPAKQRFITRFAPRHRCTNRSRDQPAPPPTLRASEPGWGALRARNVRRAGGRPERWRCCCKLGPAAATPGRAVRSAPEIRSAGSLFPRGGVGDIFSGQAPRGRPSIPGAVETPPEFPWDPEIVRAMGVFLRGPPRHPRPLEALDQGRQVL